MPKVNPETGEPMSDDPDQPSDELRGGKKVGDPDLDDASPTGGSPSVFHKGANDPGSMRGKLPGEKPANKP